MKLVSASANPDKVEEIGALLAEAGVRLVARPDDLPDVVEDADTLLGNARLKAIAVCDATGQPAEWHPQSPARCSGGGRIDD